MLRTPGGEHYDQPPMSLQKILDCHDRIQYPEARNVFVEVRIRELLKRTKPMVIEAKRFGLYEGFIHPDSVVKITQHETIPGFKVDDLTIYPKLIDELRDRRSVPESIQAIVDSYFQISHKTRDTERAGRRVQQYGRKKSADLLSVKEVSDTHIAMCAEKSAVAQNLISFLGQRSWLVDSYAKIELRDGTVDDGQHLYNVIDTSGKGLILFDVSHPFEVMYEDGQVVAVKPAQFEITREQFFALQQNEAIRVQHREEQQQGRGTKVVLREYVYGGPGSVRK
jgi:hypothetical protein